MNKKEYHESRAILRLLARVREDFIKTRIAVDNRLGRKADGKKQNLARTIPVDDLPMLIAVAKGIRKQEEEVEKELKTVLERFDIWNEELKLEDQVGTVSAAYLIGEFDIYVADTSSKMNTFAGFNPGTVKGRISVKKEEYKPGMGTIIRELPEFKDGSIRLEVRTNTDVKADRKTPGFLCPYNQRLRRVLIGILAANFILAKNKGNRWYAIYENYKNRLANSNKIVIEYLRSVDKRKKKYKGMDTREIEWKNAYPGHRDSAARRYMIKKFIDEFHAKWRAIEGLPVRDPVTYQEAYLGHKHGGAEVVYLENRKAEKTKAKKVEVVKTKEVVEKRKRAKGQ